MCSSTYRVFCVGERDVLEADLAADALQRERPGTIGQVGVTSSSWKIFSSAAIPDWYVV